MCLDVWVIVWLAICKTVRPRACVDVANGVDDRVAEPRTEHCAAHVVNRVVNLSCHRVNPLACG